MPGKASAASGKHSKAAAVLKINGRRALFASCCVLVSSVWQTPRSGSAVAVIASSAG